MRILKAILAAALILSPLAPATALAQGRPGGAIDTQAEAMDLLSRILKWQEPSGEVIMATTDTAIFILEGANRTISGEMSAKDGKAWVAGWLTQADAKVAALKARAAGLTPLPASLSQPYRTVGGPGAARQLTAIAKMPGLAQDAVASLEQYYAGVRPLIISAAGGDTQARLSLARRVIAGSRLRLANENAMLNVSLSIVTQDNHPQTQLIRSIQLTNEAMSLAFSVLERDMDPTADTTDAVATGKAMQAKLDEARAQIILMPKNGRAMAAMIKTQLGPGPLRDALVQMMGSFDESADVELRYIAVLEAVAKDLQNPEGYDSDQWNLDSIDGMIDQRMALQNKRADMLKR